MPNLTPFEIALLIPCAVLIAALAAILWWRLAGDRVKALIAGWMALPLLWKIVLPVVFGAFVLHGSVKRGEVVGDSCSSRKDGENSALQLQLNTTTTTPSLLQSSTVSSGLFRTTGFKVDSVNRILEFAVAWDDDLFDYTLSRNLFLYSSTNLLERRWTWLNTYSMPHGTDAHTFAVSLSNYDWASSAFFQVGLDIDSDNDDLADSYERLCILTDALNPDSDGDGISDGHEIALGLDPLVPVDSFLDLDGDGLTHKQELELGSDPMKSDSDGDGLDDATEHRYGWDPNWPGEINEANAPGGVFTVFDRPFTASVKFENPYEEATVYGVSEGSHTVVLSDMVTRDAHKDTASTVTNNIITVTTLDPKPIFTTNVAGVLIVKLKCDDYGVIKIGDLAVTNSWPNTEYVKAWKVIEANTTNEVDVVWDSKGGSKWNFEYECYFYPEKPHLAITNNLWIGLDRTGNPEEPYVSSNIFAQAFITPSQIPLENVTWKYSGICDGRHEDGNSLTLWTTNREVASASYRDQSIEATADGMRASSDFTVVKVDVTIGGIGEDKEETEGAFVPYVADAPDGTLSEEGTNSLVTVSIKCEPELPSNEVITISAPVGSLYLKENGLYVHIMEEHIDFQASRLKNVEFYLHGHNPSDSIGDRMVRVEHKKSGAKDCAKCTVCVLRLSSVSFSGDGYFELSCDTNHFYTYSAPHYINGEVLENLERKYPICYVRNSEMKIAADVTVMPYIQDMHLLVKANGPDGFSLSPTKAVVRDGVLSVVPTEITSKKIPNKIMYCENFFLKWFVSYDAGRTWINCGTSENIFYSIWRNPQKAPLLQTFVHIGCQSLNGIGRSGFEDVNQISGRIWDKFKTKNIRRAIDAKILTYYGYLDENENGVWDVGIDINYNSPTNCVETDALGLVKQRNGQCRSWADLFVCALAAQGVTSDNGGQIRIIGLRIKNKIEGADSVAFAVKNWFKGSLAYNELVIKSNDAGIDGLLNISCNVQEAKDDIGVSGQGTSPNPPSTFGNHFIVKSGLLYYDPSYGIGPYFDRKSYEEEAFDGYVVWDFRDELYKLRHLPKNNGAIENSEDEVCVYEE